MTAALSSPEPVAIDGVRLALRRADPARRRRTTPTLLLHGVPDNSSTWTGLAAALAGDRVVLAPDLPGLGQSEVHGPYDAQSVARVLAALVLHATEGLPGDGRVDVVGHDFGGVVALALAGARPDLVRRLVVMSAPFRKIVVHRAPHIPFFAVPGVPEVALRAGGRRLTTAMVRFAWRADEPPVASLLDAAAGYATPVRTKAMLGYYRAAVRQRVSLPDVAVERGLVVWGAADRVLTMSVAAATTRDLQRGTPDTTQLSIPGAGHWPHLEAPDAVVPAIEEFLRAP